MFDLKNLKKHHNIILYFILAIVIPNLILGILAFRGIANDQALVEKKQRLSAEEKFREAEEIVMASADDLVASFSLIQNQLNSPSDLYFQDTILEDLVSENSILGSVIYIHKDGLSMLGSSLLFIPEEEIQKEFELTSYNVVEIEQAWSYEFRKKDYNKAILAYNRIFDKSISNDEKAFALIGIARLHKKLNNINKAKETYHRIALHFPQVYINGKHPAGLVAEFELIKILAEQSKVHEAGFLLISLYEHFLKRNWCLNAPAFNFFNSEILNLYDDLKKDHPHSGFHSKMDSLRSVQNEFIESTKKIINFRNSALEYIQRDSEVSPVVNYMERIKNLHPEDFLLEILPDTNAGYWGLLINKDSVIRNTLRPFLLQNTSNQIWTMDVSSKTGSHDLATEASDVEKEYLHFVLSSPFDDYTLIASSTPRSLFKTIIGSGNGLYFYIFLVIGAILITGISYTSFLINKELSLNQLKSDFIATVSHEFKSPLTAIRQIAEMFKSDRVAESKKNAYYEIIFQEGERLNHLVDNILDMAKLEQGKKHYKYKKEDIEKILQKTIAQYRQRYSNKGIKFNLDIHEFLPKVEMDNDAINQVIHNLIDNAIKYSGQSKQVDVTATVENRFIEVSIKDYGIGIPENELSKIFSRFYRIQSDQTSGIKGSGIGLTLVKRIIEAHGGEIMVTSKQNQGSTFSFNLPVNKNKSG